MKKSLVSLLVLVFVFSIIIMGCSKNGNRNEGVNEPASADGGNAGHADANKPPVKFSISMRTLNKKYVENSPNINEDEYVKKMEEMTNVDIDIRLIPHDEFEEKMVQMFATGDIPDVVQSSGGTRGPEMAGSVEAGVFLDLKPYLEKYGQDLLKKVPKEAWERVTIDGKIYGIPEYLANPARRATWIRMDLLKKTGLEVPKTIDDFLEVLRAFKKLGVEQPYAGRENFKYADTVFGAYDVMGYNNQLELVDGKIQPKFLDVENMEKAIQMYKTMFDEGLISKEFPTINSSTFKSVIVSGKAGMWSMNAQELPVWGAQLKNNVPEAEPVLIPSPVGPDGKGGYALYGPTTRAYFINKKAEDKAADIVKFFNWMVSDEAEKFFTFGIEGKDYQVVDGKIQYKAPETNEEIDKFQFLNYWLWMVHDNTYIKGTLELTDEGRQLMDFIDNTLTKEGRSGYEFEPRLDAWVNNPDINPNSDQFSPLINEHIMKMVFGKEPISDWPKVIEEWKSKGGNDLIKEATEKYNNGDFHPPLR
ncbi:MAG TPA: extracellular solute-binding protein [Bacilli bacterium]